MKNICFYFQIHQPFRVGENSLFRQEEDLFVGPPDYQNEAIFNKVADKCYLPMTTLLVELSEKYPDFKVAFSLSGTFIDQCEMYPENGKPILSMLKKLVRSGNAEILAETYYHSLAFLYSKAEYARQIQMHTNKIFSLFRKKPIVFRNTELIYRNDIGEFIRNMGYDGIITEGWEQYLQGKNPNDIQKAHKVPLHPSDYDITQKFARKKTIKKDLPILTKNYQLSDDVAFRFSSLHHQGTPLMADTFTHWIHESPGSCANLFMDYETFGEHQWEDTGIFEFMRALPGICEEQGIKFITPSESIHSQELPEQTYDVYEYLSWADSERDITAWAENEMQHDAFAKLANLENEMYWMHDHIGIPEIAEYIRRFGYIQTSDHMYYMSTKFWSDGDVHTYFSPFDSPYEAAMYFFHTIEKMRLEAEQLKIVYLPKQKSPNRKLQKKTSTSSVKKVSKTSSAGKKLSKPKTQKKTRNFPVKKTPRSSSKKIVKKTQKTPLKKISSKGVAKKQISKKKPKTLASKIKKTLKIGRYKLGFKKR